MRIISTTTKNAMQPVAERMWKERRGVENGNCATNKQTIISKWEGDLNWVPQNEIICNRGIGQRMWG